MTYLTDQSAHAARGSRVGSAMGGIGDTTADPVATLIAEVNRFGPNAPETFRYVATPYPLATGNVPTQVAFTAAFIYHRRAQDAALKFGDKGTLDLVAKASQGLKNPQAFVTANLAEVTNVVRLYADANGLPASQLSLRGKVAGLASSPLVLAAVGAGVLLFVMTSRKRRSR